jgi:ATP-dependent Clp protease ATP-binding subunit ClpC
MMDSVPNFTPRAQEAIRKAREFAIDYKSSSVRLEHLLLGLLSQGRGLLREAFILSENDLDSFKIFVESDLAIGDKTCLSIKYASEVKAILELSYTCASDLDQAFVGTEHILLSIIKTNSPIIGKLFRGAGIDHKSLTNALRAQLLEGAKIDSDTTNTKEPRTPAPQSNEKRSALESFGINYNNLAKEGKFDDVLCPEEVISDITESLCRKTKNNPLLLGQPGVGKTAIVEGLAKRIVSNECAEHLMGHVIFGLDLASMIAGTKYRGQFEERLKNVLKELKQVPSLILFIDEIHTLVGAGSAEGTMDAANILKPTLARGEIRCIGATTLPEYKKTIEKDGALARRFQPIMLDEPSPSDCKKILHSLKTTYEEFHNVIYEEDAINACVELSVKYIHERQLPDKAIDLLDQAGSKLKVMTFKRPRAVQKIEKDLEALMEAEDEASSSSEKKLLLRKQDSLFEKYKKAVQAWSRKNAKRPPKITSRHIQELIASKINVPLSQISSSLSTKLASLEEDLNKKIIGQQSSIKSLAEALIRNKVGLKSDKSPIGSFLLLGASGTGKTHTAQTIAKTLFGSKDNFIKINMTEYSDSFTSSKLIGAAPGYVGYEQAGQLTESVRRNPYSVILFDEIEKAHPNVVQMLLQILDEGLVRDNMGRDINFRSCIIVITGNVGASLTKGKATMAFGGGAELNSESIKADVVAEAKKQFPPEFINRLDDILVFNNFDDESYLKILNLELGKLKKSLKTQNVSLSVYKPALTHLAATAKKENDGARPVERIIQNKISNTLAKRLLTKETDPFCKIIISYKNDQLTFKYK